MIELRIHKHEVRVYIIYKWAAPSHIRVSRGNIVSISAKDKHVFEAESKDNKLEGDYEAQQGTTALRITCLC